MKNQSIEIITTGEELLSGITQDSNFYWLAKQVFSMGFKVRRLGKKNMRELLRVIGLNIADDLEDNIQSLSLIHI